MKWPVCHKNQPYVLRRPLTAKAEKLPRRSAGQVVLPPAATLCPISGLVLGKCVCREGPLRVVWRPDGDPDLSGFPPDADVGA